MSTIEKVALYLGGNMSLQEKQDFEQEMKSNPDLYREVQLQDAINHHLGEQDFSLASNTNAYKKKLEDIIQNEDSKKIKEVISSVNKEYNLKNSKNRNPIKMYFLFSAAAVVVLFLGSYFLILSPSSNDLYEQYYSTSDLPSFVQRSSSDGEQLRLEKVASLFHEEKYEQVLSALEALHQDNSERYLTRIYSALSYMNLGNQEKALGELEVLAHANSLDAHKAYWFQSLVYLKFKDKKRATVILNNIAQSSSNYKYAEAKEILEKL